MPRRISDVFKVAPEELRARGVFNAFVDVDTKLYIDPFLLRKTSVPELNGAYSEYRAHFENIFRILARAQHTRDPLFRKAAALLRFPELRYQGLGYSSSSTRGTGIGPRLAWQLAETARHIIRAGISDPAIFDLVGLFETNVGPDRISDMATHLILPSLLAFSERVASELRMRTYQDTIAERIYQIPQDPVTRAPIILIPFEVLRTLPVALSLRDLRRTSAETAELRNRVNMIVGATWKDTSKKVKKADLRRRLLSNPDLLRDLLSAYQCQDASSYDVDKDPGSLLSWYDDAQRVAQRFPFTTARETPPIDVVRRICEHFGTLIEANGLWALFYDDAKELRPERYAQLLFFAIADAYCTANNLDLSREPNAGRGAVDFKVTRGIRHRILVELKYSSNSHLLHGYRHQLTTYEKAEKAHDSVYLILRTTPSDAAIQTILQLRNGAAERGVRAPEVLVYDARMYASASKG